MAVRFHRSYTPSNGYLWRFDTDLRSTTGLEPEPGYVVTLRPGEGKFGGAVAVEEGTTNLVTSPTSPIASDWGSYGFGDLSTDTQITVAPGEGHGGVDALKVTRLTTTYSVMTCATTKITIPTVPPNGYVTLSGWVKGVGSTVGRSLRLHLHGSKAGGGNFSIGLFVGALTAEHQRFSYTWQNTLGVDATVTNIYFVVYGSGPVGEYFLVSKPQLEQKPFATPFVDGTRAAGVLKYSGDKVSGDEFTIAMWARAYTSDPAQTQGLFEGRSIVLGSSAGSCQCVLGYSGDDLYLWHQDSAGTNRGNNTGLTVTDRHSDYHFYAVTYSGTRASGTFRVFFDGVQVYELNSSLYAPGSAPIFNLGEAASGQFWNGLLDELLILPRAVSAEEIKAWYGMRRLLRA